VGNEELLKMSYPRVNPVDAPKSATVYLDSALQSFMMAIVLFPWEGTIPNQQFFYVDWRKSL
jgi:hypothetical protein